MCVHAIVVLSNHFHMLIAPEDVKQMAAFMGHFKTNLSKEVGRLYDWPGSLFDRRYSAIVVSDEPEAQIARFEYLLAQGCKEGLVASPRDWPGVQSGIALADGADLQGVWIDRRAMWAARQRGENASAQDFSREVAVHLAPLPCWAHLSETEVRRRIGEMLFKIKAETRARHRRQGTRPAGWAAILRVRPHHRVAPLVARPPPRFHAFSRRTRRKLENAYREFSLAYRRAADRLRMGEWPVVFPAGCFPPRLPFVQPPMQLESI